MDISKIPGIGPKKKEKLNKLGIYTAIDLLNYLPKRYEDRTNLTYLKESNYKTKSLYKLKVKTHPTTKYLKNNLSITECICEDRTGKCKIIWFNQPYIKNKISLNKEYYFFGEVKINNLDWLEMSNPLFNLKLNKDLGKIVPIYQLCEGISNKDLIKFITYAFNNINIKNILPEELISEYNLLNKKEVIRNLHFPVNKKLLIKARKTFVFEEVLIIQISLLYKNNFNSYKKGNKIKISNHIHKFIEKLPYELTNAQKRVINEIFIDMKSNKVMNRLIQGDVGSGKTIIALIALLNAHFNGYQGLYIAPTEILATQHYETISNLLKDYDINIDLLKGSLKDTEKNTIKKKLALKKIDIIIGTHALLEDDVVFNNLGLSIVDEQHKFGVLQRSKIVNKGKNVDNIIMTATPIPRTLSLLLYGDLDISIIDELPPGRRKIDTYAVNLTYEKRIMKFIEKQLKLGRQAYIVCPLVEENDNLKLNSVEKLYKKVTKKYLSSYNIGFIHGKLKPFEKDKIMEQFVENKIQVLLATTVVEVGVDVPNANLIVIYNSERFGLSQLHQLRGRVGRGKHKSYCILINEGNSQVSRQRMNVMKSTNDGFVISEEDLKIRGSGDIFGVRQSGISTLQLVGINDIKLLEIIKKISRNILNENLLHLATYKELRNSVERFLNNIDNIILN